MVSLAEHLRGVVAQARSNRAPEQREKNQRELRAALRALGSAANSFGEKQVARFAAEWSVRVATLNNAQMEALDRAARCSRIRPRARKKWRAGSSASPHRARRRRPGCRRRAGDAVAAPRTPTPIVRCRDHCAHAVSAPISAAPGQRDLAVALQRPVSASRTRRASPLRAHPRGGSCTTYLQNGIAGFGALETTPLSTPVVLPDEAIVPIESLLYRGKAALDRARGAQVRGMLAERAPPRETIEELFDLLDLAIAE